METSPITNIIVDAYYDVVFGPGYNIYYVRILIKIDYQGGNKENSTLISFNV